jgi:hypothetical protein
MGFFSDCFSRGLLREALGQLAGLKRRKMALEMLGAAVQAGLNKRLSETNGKQKERSNKRRRESDDGDGKNEEAAEDPAAKKSRTEAELTA